MKVIEVTDIEGLKTFEKISPRVSAKYTPIYSSELVNTLEPEFNLVKATKICNSSSMHFVDLVNKDGDCIRFYNSFDRCLAFRMSLVTEDGLVVGLGSDRVKHIGVNAKNLVSDTTEHKANIIESVKIAKTIAKVLNTEKINPSLAKTISDVVFKSVTAKKGFQDYTNYVDVLVETKTVSVSIADYINKTVKNFLEGNFSYTLNGVKKIGRANRSTFKKVEIETNLINFLGEEFPEYFL